MCKQRFWKTDCFQVHNESRTPLTELCDGSVFILAGPRSPVFLGSAVPGGPTPLQDNATGRVGTFRGLDFGRGRGMVTRPGKTRTPRVRA